MFHTRNLFSALLLLVALFFVACEENVSPDTLTLDFSGLEDLGDSYQYEGWLIVDGQAISSGTFTVDENGTPSQTEFNLAPDELEMATAFVLTLEPVPDNDPAPSNIHLVGGDFTGSSAPLAIDHGSAIGQNFASAMGTYILATPTDGMDNNENSGIWFLDPTAGPGPGLTLPPLPDGWIYEGWAVTAGQPITTGRFTRVDASDDSAPFSGNQAGPPFPGEDFLVNAPGGLNFPLDLAGGAAVISIEPVPDNSPAPFLLKPLVGDIPAAAADHTPYSMGLNATSFPTGTARR